MSLPATPQHFKQPPGLVTWGQLADAYGPQAANFITARVGLSGNHGQTIVDGETAVILYAEFSAQNCRGCCE